MGTSKTLMMGNKRIHQLTALLLSSSLPFLFTLQGEFVFDDTEAIIKNKDVSSKNWMEVFNNDFWGTNIKSTLSHKSYRPLTILTFKLNYFLNNNNFSPIQYKVTNLICHMLCTILVWRSFEGFVNDTKSKFNGRKCTNMPFIAALLFAVHPIHTEAVCGIVGRADILAGVTFFLAIILYQRARCSRDNYIYVVFTVICAGHALLFKENGVTVLGVCFFYDILYCVDYKKELIQGCDVKKLSFKFDKNLKKRLIIILIAITVLLYGRWKIMGESKPEFKPTDNPGAFSSNYLVRVATFNYIYFLNILLLFWPQWLCYDWSMGCIPLIENFLDVRILTILGMYLYGFLILWTFKRDISPLPIKRMMILAIMLIIIPFIPASNIFYYVGFVVAERIMYISSAGYCLLIAIGLDKITHKIHSKYYKITVYILLILNIFIFGLKSWKRSYDWQNEYQLYLSGLFVCPLNAKIHYNVAKVADATQQTEFALKEYNEALRLYPGYYQAMNNLANMLRAENKYKEAEKLLRNAIKHKNDFSAAWMNLGIVLASTKQYEEALIAYKTALQHRKKYPDCLYNLGNLYLETSQSQEATDHWIQAIRLNPKHVLAWTNLLALLDNSGDLKQALELIPKVLDELPESPSVIFSIANIYGKLDRFQEAEDYFIKAIKLFGPNVQAIHYSNLGVLYHRWKKYDKAKQTYLRALKINPSFKSAVRNLKMLESV